MATLCYEDIWIETGESFPFDITLLSIWPKLPTFTSQKTERDLKTEEQRSYYGRDKTILDIPYWFYHSVISACSECAGSLPSRQTERLLPTLGTIFFS